MAATANTSRSITPGVTIEMSDDEKYLCACHRFLFMPELPAMPMSSLR